MPPGLQQVCGGLAEFEHTAGLKRAVAQGKQFGRPRRIDAALEKRIQAQLRTGKGIVKVARECGVGIVTVERIAWRWAALSPTLPASSIAVAVITPERMAQSPR
jgi:hypothetical protein